MFQNIQEERENLTKEETSKKKNILTNSLSKRYIVLYIVTFMVSTIGLGQAFSPASLAIIMAIGANEIPIIIALVLGLVGNIIGCGIGSILYYIITLLIFFASFFVREPKYNEESRNEKIKFGRRIFFSSLTVGVLKVIISGFLFYDFLLAITMSMFTFVLYKIFVNAITVILNFGKKRAFTMEEMMGASVLLTIAICALGGIQIFGFSIRNIIAIFLILFLGWKNGMLVGATSGITIGVTLGIVANTEPLTIAAYAISGLVAGILNKFGKIGVIVGFVLGDILLTYLSNGGVENLIIFKEILIAGIGLLAVPKNIKLDIESILGDKPFLPVGANRGLNRSSETAEKIKKVSKAVEEIAQSYVETQKPEDLKEKNKQIFITELLNSIEYMEDNILYENLSNVEGKIVNDLFEKLLENQFIKERDLINVFADNNNYIVGFEDEDKTIYRDVEKMTRAINSAYRISKMNFIWNIKIKEEKQNVGSQLNGVSKALSAIADDLKNEIHTEIESSSLFEKEKEAISILLKQKEILVEEIAINKKDEDRLKVEIYIEKTRKRNIADFILSILEKNLNEKLSLIEQKNIEEQKLKKYVYISADKFNIEIGQAIAIKDEMTVSGDSMLHIRLKDGKYLLAISDGMGSGKEAKKSSGLVIKMLQKLLDSGFNKETSIDLINTNLLNVGEDVYATLDLAIVDLYKGSIEFIKAGCMPTYIKNNKKIQLIKSSNLPTGIVKNISKNTILRKIEDGDLILMCSDGVIDSNIEYKNKALWIKYLLEDIQNTNPQKVADLVLNEAIDNNYGKVKDDMSIITCKFSKI